MKVSIKERKFKDIENNPSILGFGCMRFPLLENGEIDEELAYKMIDYAYEKGITYFDTAYPYHKGESEIFIGKALKKYPRESFFLADKMPTWEIKSVEDCKRIFFEQLEKCQVEYFDYYLLHALDKNNFNNYKLPGIMDFFYKMKEEGKIRHLGFSFHDTPEVLEDIVNTFKFDFVQIQLNYLDWTYQKAKEQYEILEKNDLPIVIMEPVRGGTLADLGEECNLMFKEYNKEASIASWAIRYAASKNQVMCVLSGMSNFEQVKDNINSTTLFKKLNDDEENLVIKVITRFFERRIVPCTGCRYCMDCPKGVDIPLNFRMYNNFKISNYEEGYVKNYLKLEKAKASTCVNCKLCISKCPQHILIPDRLKEIDTFISSVKNKYSI